MSCLSLKCDPQGVPNMSPKNALERNCQMSDPITTTPDPKHASSSFRQQSYNFSPATAAVTSDFALDFEGKSNFT